MIGLLPGRPSERLAWQWRGMAGIVAVADCGSYAVDAR